MYPRCLKCSWRDLVFPILLFSSISLHWSLRKVSYLSLLFFETLFFEFRWVYLSFSPLSSASLLFSAIVRPPQTNHFALLHFFFLGMVFPFLACFLVPARHRSIPFLSFIVPIFPWNVPLVSLIFLKRFHPSHSSVFLYFFALITEEGFLISPVILCNSASRWVYVFFSHLLLASLLSSL